MEIFILISFFLGLILLVVFLIRYTRKLNRRKIEWYKEWGLKLGLTHTVDKYMLTKINTLSGSLDGHPVTIYEKIVGSGKHQTVYTIVSFMPNPFDFEFKIGKEGFFTKIGKSLGKSDIEFGNEEFDKTFLLKSKEENRFRSLMDFRMQQALTEIDKDLRAAILSKGTEFQYTMIGAFNKQERMVEYERVIDFMLLLIKNQR